MADNVTLAFHIGNNNNVSCLPHFHSTALLTSAAAGGRNRLVSNKHQVAAFSSSCPTNPALLHSQRRPDSVNSGSSSLQSDCEWSPMMEASVARDELGSNREAIRRTISVPISDEEVEDEKEGAAAEHELEWFKQAGLDSLVAQMLDNDSGKSEEMELELRTLTKSQSDTVRRRLSSLQNTISKSSEFSRAATSTDVDYPGSESNKSFGSGILGRRGNKAQWRDVRDVFGVERRCSSSSESQDGDLDMESSSKSSRSDHLSSMDSVDSTALDQKISELYPENYRAQNQLYRQAYCLVQPEKPVSKTRSPPHRWMNPLGGQAAADIVGHDPETGVRILKINYKQGYDTIVEQEPPLPQPIWPKSPKAPHLVPDVLDLKLEFAYKLHPADVLHAEWPNIILKSEPGGICCVDDLLWEGDVRSVKQLSLIELTKIFEDNRLDISKRRTKPKKKIKNSPETGVFGSSLDRLVVLDNNRRRNAVIIDDETCAPKVPIVLQQMLSYMEECGGIYEEGMLRICGETNRMRRLRSELDSFYSNPVLPDDACVQADESQWFRRVFQTVSVHDIASVMKQFLRDLPQPLITNELVEAFSQVSEIPDRLTQIKALNLLVLQLPAVERTTLKEVLRFLRKMLDGEKLNKMSSANIAMIITPNLFHPKVTPVSPPQPQGFFASNLSISSTHSSEKRDDPAKQFGLVAKLSEVTRMMIVYCNLLFTVPPSLLQQIRQKNICDSFAAKNAKKPKDRRIRRLDPRRIKSKTSKSLPVLPETDVKTDSTFFQQQFPQEDAVVVRVRLGRRSSSDGENHKVSTAVQVTPGLTAGDVVAKFLPSSSLASSPEISTSADPLNLSTSSGVSGSDKSSSSSNEDLLGIDGPRRSGELLVESRRESEPPVSLHTHFLMEQGGNIGYRRLEHGTSMMAACRQNPKATWIVKYFPDL